MLKQFLSVIFDEELKRSVKRAGRKALSVALALLMVFSMFAFAPEMFMKASAADSDRYGKHKVRISLIVGDDEWESDNGTKLYVYYRETKTGTEKQALICTATNNNFNSTDTTYWLGNPDNSAGANDQNGRDGIYVDGFPTGWNFTGMHSKNSCQNASYEGHLWVLDETSGQWVDVATISDSIGSDKSFNNKSNQVDTAKYPKSTTMSWENLGSEGVSVKPSENVTVSGTKAATVYDQYGVVLPTADLAFRLYDSESGTTAVSADYATVAKASDKPTVTVKPAAADWVLAGGGTQRSMYVQAYCGSVNSGGDRFEVIVSNYSVHVTYDLNTGEYWGTEDDHSATASEDVSYGFYPAAIPASAYKRGYNFNGIFTAATGGTQVTASTQIKENKTFYAQWTPYVNVVEYYNSDGQLVQSYDSAYDQSISGAGSPSAPSYPGKTQAIDGTYIFDKWIVWDCPTHPDWVGKDRDTITSNKLDLDNDGGVAIKFIATYKLGTGASVKDYTATFKNAGGSSIGSTTGAYWTPYTPYDLTTKPALAQGAAGTEVTTANDFVLSDYDYTFEGWTTKVPSNGKWGTEADVEYTSADTLRLKENITFYPCYSKVTKQCAVTKNYYKLDEGNITFATENIEKSLLTELHRMYDLGAADPFSFNYGGFTYTFKGWSETNVALGNVPESYIAYESGSATISLDSDVTVWAVYEKSEIKYNAYYYNGSSLIGQYENLSRYSDGVELITYTIADQYNGAVPVKERAVQTGYTFAGWVEDPAKAINPAEEDLVTSYTFGEQSRTFYAAFNTYSFYRATFINDEGEMLQTSSDYVYGDVISYTEEAPEEEDVSLIPVVNNKASGVQYQYTFMGWMSSERAENTLSFEDEAEGTVNYAVAKGEGNNITVSGDRTYTAVFKKELREYDISLYGIGVDLENKDAPAPEPIAVLTLKYGSNILNAVKALYDYGEADEADKNVVAINGSVLKVLPYGEENEANLPYANDIYAYSFYGWTPSINANATVTKNASYVATYRTDNVLYSTHWYTPTACDATEPYAGQGYTEQVITYRYQRAIGTPAKTPSVAAPTTVDNYSWTFLGWYECDENQVIKTDEDGNEIKYTKGTLADPGDNHNRDFYYVAKFGFTANDYTVNVYDEAGTVVLGSYTGEYTKPVNLGNFKKNYDETNHYTLESFVDMSTGAETAADLSSDTTAYTVMCNADLKVKYKAEAHNWEEAAVAHTILPTYEIDGLNTLTCTCGCKKTEKVDKFVDSYGPIGRVVINEYTWNAEDGPEEAYIGEDAIISIVSVDRGDKEDVTNVGEGIKSISYEWSNGESGSTAGVQYIDTAKNFGIPMAAEFTDGMTLTAVITDYTDKTYTITTGKLYIDIIKPVIEIEATCEGYMFGVKEERFSRVEVTIDGEAADISEYEVKDAEGYAVAYIAEPEEGETETKLVPEGFYIITAYDKAGNKAEARFRVTNKHEWNDGKITTKVTCTTDGVKTFTCTVCGDTKTEDIKAEGHKWNGIYDEEGVLTEYTYTVDKAPTCEEKGEKSVYCSVCGEMLEDSTVELEATGHDYEIKESEATCSAAGYKVTTCKNCDFYEHLSYPQLTHEIDTEAEGADENGWIIGKEATCSAKGSMYQICKLCKEHINVTEIALKAHSFEDVTPNGTYCKAAPFEGATEDTYHLWKCKDCGYSYTFNLDAKLHDYELTETKEATCTSDKVYTYTCSKCEDVLEEVERLTSLGGHVWDDGEVTKEATCFEEGVKTYKCTNAGCTETKTVAIPKIDHTWDEGVVTKAANCTEDGEMTYTCTVEGCGATKTEVIDKNENGHGIEDDDWVVTEATCLVDGKKVATCPHCHNEITVVIPATGAHKKADGDEGTPVEATCQHKAGLEYTCEVCTEKFVEYDENTEYADHVKGEKVEAKCTAPTCEGEGEDIYICSVCEEEFAVVTAPAGHKYDVTLTGECKDNDGKQYHEYKCSVCERVYVDNIALKEHKYGEEKVDVVPATCTENGTYKLACEVCGAKSEAKINHEDPMTGHKAAAPVKENVVAATCTEDGSHDDVIRCETCEEVLKKTEKVVDKALGHDYIVDTEEATCYADGKKTTTCSRCDYNEEEILPMDESLHAWGEGVETKEASCTEDGEMTYTCTVEECKKTKTEAIPATGHTPTEEGGEVIDEGDCKHRSVIEYTCKTCTEKYTEEGPFGTHVLGDLIKVTKAPTCTAAGSGIYNCDVCGATMPNIAIAATGEHTWDNGKITSVATCTDDGEMTYTCTVCGEKKTEKIDSLGGHDWVETAKVPASCKAEGMEAYIQCSKCKQYAVKDEEGKYEITETEPQVIAKEDHTPTVDEEEKLVYVQTVAPTCAKFGKEVNKCSVCGEVLETRAVAKADHTKGDLITVNTPVTCQQDGEYVYKCSVCSETFVLTVEASEEYHSYGVWSAWKDVEGNEATCTEAGQQERSRKCDFCDKVDTETKEVPALNHDFSVFVKNEVTVSEDGKTTTTTPVYKCSRCEETQNGEATSVTNCTVTVTVGEATYEIPVKSGEQLTEEMVLAAVGEIDTALTPAQLAAGEDDGVNKVVWSPALPCTVEADMTVSYSLEYVANTYTVIFRNADGFAISTKDYLKGEEVEVPDDLIVAGYKFLGWTDGTTQYASGDTITVAGDGNKEFTPVLDPMSKYTTFTVNFMTDSGTTVLHTDVYEVREGAEGKTPVEFTAQTKAYNSTVHYVWFGWVKTKSGSDLYNFTEKLTYKADERQVVINLYAKFDTVTHTPKTSAVTQEQACDKYEVTTHTCSCGYTWTQNTKDPLGHDYVLNGEPELAGNQTIYNYKCSRCDSTYKKVVTTGDVKNGVNITVKDGNGAAVADAKVMIYLGNNMLVSKTTDANGVVTFPTLDVEHPENGGLADGSYAIKVEKTGYDTLSGKVLVTNAKGVVTLGAINKIVCHCVCHSSGFFGTIKRFFNNIIRFFNKGYTCCSCGECEKIH